MILTDDRDISFDFTDAVDAFVFDQMDSGKDNYHGISDMRRVDFVVELDEAILFVEVKDPDHPNAQQEGIDKFLKKLEDGTLGDSFAKKLMDSFVYRWAEKKVNKPLYYLSLVTLESELLHDLTDEVASKLPPQQKPVDRWQRAFLKNCQIFNIETWNENFPKWPVTRISSQAS